MAHCGASIHVSSYPHGPGLQAGKLAQRLYTKVTQQGRAHLVLWLFQRRNQAVEEGLVFIRGVPGSASHSPEPQVRACRPPATAFLHVKWADPLFQLFWMFWRRENRAPCTLGVFSAACFSLRHGGCACPGQRGVRASRSMEPRKHDAGPPPAPGSVLGSQFWGVVLGRP